MPTITDGIGERIYDARCKNALHQIINLRRLWTELDDSEFKLFGDVVSRDHWLAMKIDDALYEWGLVKE